MVAAESVTGTQWLEMASSPSAAMTALTASSTGMPAASSAPKATSRIASVTGTADSSARWKSLPSVSSSARLTLAWPACSMRSPGWRA
jgi:hypothetical protein